MEPRNILYICDYAARYTGSFIASMLALTEKAREKYAVYFLFPEAAREHEWIPQLAPDPDKVFFCEFTPAALERKCRELKVELGKKNTIVHTHFVADLNLLAVRMHFCQIFYHCHMSVPSAYSLGKKIKQMVRQVIYHGVVIICVSEGVKNQVNRYFRGLSAETVPNAVDFKRMESSKAEAVNYGSSVGENQFSVLIHGTDFITKGADFASKAVEKLGEVYGDKYKLYVTSNCIEQTSKQIAECTENRNNIQVIPTVENIASLYSCMDLFISPSREEAFGYAVVEASYFDCQVAASDIPGQNTMKCVPGILWMEREDIEGIKRVILEAAGRKEKGLTEAIKQEQRAFVIKEFDMSVWADRIMNVYEKYI